MKVIDFHIDKVHSTASIKYKLTEDELNGFDLRNYLHIDIQPVAHDRDRVIRATFRALDYPIEMMDYTFNRDRSGKTRKIAEVRQACMYQLRKHTDLSFAAIGKLFNFTHATVIYNIRQFQNRLDMKDDYALVVDREVEYILDEQMLKKS